MKRIMIDNRQIARGGRITADGKAFSAKYRIYTNKPVIRMKTRNSNFFMVRTFLNVDDPLSDFRK